MSATPEIWQEFQDDFFGSWGDRLVRGGGILPEICVVTQDFRRAVPLGCGTGTSYRYPDVAPICEEISSAQLQIEEETWKEFGETWLHIVFGVAEDYGGLFQSSHGFGPGSPRGDEILDRWGHWLRETPIWMIGEPLNIMFDIVCMHRFLDLPANAFGGVFDAILSAGGFPCGTDRDQEYANDLFDLPSPLLVYWPWIDRP